LVGIALTLGSASITNATEVNTVLEPVDVTPLRIMCLGDSITVGYTDNPSWANHPFEFGYRSGLYTRLLAAGYDFAFVGGSTEPWTGISGDPTHGGTVTPTLDLRDFNQDGHRGYGGAAIPTIHGGIVEWMAADNPNVILLLVGINGGPGAPAQLDSLVNTIVTIVPNVHLIIAQITPLVSYDESLWNYNVHIRDTLVPTYAGDGYEVTTVDLYSLFLTNPNDPTSIAPGVLANNINHPNNEHYDQMAQAWFEGIEALGLGAFHGGDCNQDGVLDISDPICLIGFLFDSTPAELPCGPDTGSSANLAVFDTNGDGSIDLSDVIYKLGFLFNGGPPPVQGTECFYTADCPDNSIGCS
jgi:lysophospholipase L1-like esterase